MLGFRKGRSAKDAGVQIFCVLARKCSPKWIIEGDIKGCFDNINHKWLLANIPMDKRIMRQFLKSGYIFHGDLFPTQTGSPQGEAISSIYANTTMDGLEKLIQDKYHRNSNGNIENRYRANTKVNLVRYADDFIITADSREIAEELKLLVSNFLQSRGLQAKRFQMLTKPYTYCYKDGQSTTILIEPAGRDSTNTGMVREISLGYSLLRKMS